MLAMRSQSAAIAIQIVSTISLKRVNFRASLRTVRLFRMLCAIPSHTLSIGGCLLQCDVRLECGHICPYKVSVRLFSGVVHVLESSSHSAIRMTLTIAQLYVSSAAPDSVSAVILA